MTAGRGLRFTVLQLFIVGLLALAGFGRLLDPDTIVYSPHSDIIAYHLGTKYVLHDSFDSQNGLPFWRNDQYSGYPAFTNPQFQATYPLNFLFFLASPLNAVDWTLFIHLLLYPLLFYWIGALLNLKAPARMLVAVAALFNFKLIIAVYAGWLSPVSGITMFPLMFAGVLYLYQKPGVKSALLVALGVSLCLHTGHLQFFYYACLFIVLWTAIITGRYAKQRNYGEGGAFLGWGAAGAATGLLSAAYLLLPAAAESSLISRSLADYEFFSASHILTFKHLATLIHPEILGSPLEHTYKPIELWEDVAYFGLVPLMLAIFGIIRGRRRRHTGFLTLGFAVSLLLSLDTPVLKGMYHAVPLFDLFRNPSRFLFLTSFFGILLAGIGLDEITWLVRRSQKKLYLWSGLYLIALAVIAGEGIHYSRRYVQTIACGRVVPETACSRHLSRDPSLFRVAPLGRYALNYGWAAPMGLELISGYDGYLLTHYQRYMSLMQYGRPLAPRPTNWLDFSQLARPDLLDALNVKYILSRAPLALPEDRFKPVARWEKQPVFQFYRGLGREDLYLYKNLSAKDRAFWADTVTAVKKRDALKKAMAEKRLTAGRRDRALILSDRRLHREFPDTAEAAVRIRRPASDKLSITIDNDSKGFLVVSEVWHSGWRATIDGKPLELFQTDLALCGVFTPPGRHRIELTFRPLMWKPALMMTAGGLVLMAVLGVAAFRRRF